MSWRWPTPQRFDVAGISTQGYHGDVSFPMTLRGKIPPTLSGVLTLSTCSNVCILTDYPFSLDMTTPAGERFNYDFTRAMGTLPLRDGLTFAADRQLHQRKTDGDRPPRCRLAAASAVYRQHGGCRFRQTELYHPRRYVDRHRTGHRQLGRSGAGSARGKTLSLVLADSGQAQESQVAVAAGSAAPGLALGWVLLMALAGGLILNVMPCVPPVLAMKLGSLVQTEGRERGAVRRQFLASVCGIVVSFLALALMMTALRLGIRRSAGASSSRTRGLSARWRW